MQGSVAVRKFAVNGKAKPVARRPSGRSLRYDVKRNGRASKKRAALRLRSGRRSAPDALADVTSFLRPGDVINISGHDPWWQLWWQVPNAAIRGNQRRIFGAQSIWHDTHCILYLDPQHTLSVQPWRARWLTAPDYCRKRISIWRFTKHAVFPKEEIDLMMAYAQEHLIGQVYDIGQLLDILVNTILGYPNVIHYRIFDWGRSRKVCSVGVRVLFERLRQVLEDNGRPSFKPLFRKLNPTAPWPGGVFPQSRIPDQYGVDVESTAPAHFANSHYFDGEFELVAVFDQGWRVYPLP